VQRAALHDRCHHATLIALDAVAVGLEDVNVAGLCAQTITPTVGVVRGPGYWFLA
jgi:hypothetical protein